MYRILALAATIVASLGACSEQKTQPTAPDADGASVKVLLAQDSERLYVSVINVSNFNFRWDSYPRAEQTGDVTFNFVRDGNGFPSLLRSSEIIDSDGLVWIQSGDGIVISRRKALLVERFRLVPGCYDLSVHVTNRAAVVASGSENENSGPVVEAGSEVLKVCI